MMLEDHSQGAERATIGVTCLSQARRQPPRLPKAVHPVALDLLPQLLLGSCDTTCGITTRMNHLHGRRKVLTGSGRTR